MAIGRTTLIKKDHAKMSVPCILLTVLVLAVPVLGHTQGTQGPSTAPTREAPQTPGPAAQPSLPETAPRPIMEQRPLDQLKRISATLGAAKAFTYRSRSTVEVPAKTGQFVTLFATSDVALQRLDKLHVRVTEEVPNFEFYYNGTTLVAFAPKTRVYSLARAPATLDEMLKFAMDNTRHRPKHSIKCY